MHFRLPSIAPGITAFIWALVLGFYLWLLLRAVGVSSGTSFVLGLLCFGGTFLFVRLRGGDPPGREL